MIDPSYATWHVHCSHHIFPKGVMSTTKRRMEKQVKGLDFNRLRHLITFIQNFLIRPGQPFLPPYRPNAGILDMEMLHMGFRAWP